MFRWFWRSGYDPVASKLKAIEEVASCMIEAIETKEQDTASLANQMRQMWYCIRDLSKIVRDKHSS